jgi:hypothetical protein
MNSARPAGSARTRRRTADPKVQPLCRPGSPLGRHNVLGLFQAIRDEAEGDLLEMMPGGFGEVA